MPLSIMIIEDDTDRALMEYIFNRYQRLMYQTIFQNLEEYPRREAFGKVLRKQRQPLAGIKSVVRQPMT